MTTVSTVSKMFLRDPCENNEIGRNKEEEKDGCVSFV